MCSASSRKHLKLGKDAIATKVPEVAQGVTGRWNPSDGTLMGGLPNSTYSFTQTYSQIGFI
jgi:hypothetical protein